MNTRTTLKEKLKELKEILQRERRAIITLKMKALAEIQKEKINLLKDMDAKEAKTAGGCLALVLEVTRENIRNERLLQSGLRIISVMQDSVCRKRMTVYAQGGLPQQNTGYPLVINRRS